MTEEFYATLLSNSSMEYFPSNTTSNFVTQLPKRIRLNGRWCVGVSEIQYPCSFASISEIDNLIYYRVTPPEDLSAKRVLKNAADFFRDDSEQITYHANGWHVIRFASGNYDTVEDVVREMNKHEIIGRLVTLEYYTLTKRVSVQIKTETLSILGFSERLALQLGFRPEQNIVQDPVPPHPASIWIGLPSQMFIYCDIVEPQIVGNVVSPLMRIVNITAENYNYGCHKDVVFSPTHYIPVMIKEFENIEINIRTDTGQSMPFEFGTLSLKLHFKKWGVHTNSTT
uniref:Uncharacterized protein n=1 Tax=Photinus pyralis TaxID=7054 RepID=A0A1Y1KYY2_PHOPY